MCCCTLILQMKADTHQPQPYTIVRQAEVAQHSHVDSNTVNRNWP